MYNINVQFYEEEERKSNTGNCNNYVIVVITQQCIKPKLYC